MNFLAQIIAYYCLHYPYPGELSDARLTKMVYLSDWFSSLSQGNQLTNISWYFNHYGPYVDDILNTVQSRPDLFDVNIEPNYYGNSKKTIRFRGNSSFINLPPHTRRILDTVMSETQHMYFNDFIDFVYSTYPIAKNDRYAYLDLPRLAREYQAYNR